jgi:4-oxalocrotonate tautomerase
MPTLHLQLTPLQNPARYALLAERLTHLTAEVLHKRPEVTVVVINDLPTARWFIGGQVPSRPTACLSIDITAGTNTASEKAEFIAQAFAELERLLGAGQSLAPASYVLVRELPASDWGYGGQTQAHRQAQRHAISAGAVA